MFLEATPNKGTEGRSRSACLQGSNYDDDKKESENLKCARDKEKAVRAHQLMGFMLWSGRNIPGVEVSEGIRWRDARWRSQNGEAAGETAGQSPGNEHRGGW